ncbi:uncharacterized protein [Amphiura filiformis]|uniref:uncharacterized protein n=1 Tax=Amphiura filiformis TaxID=82378 RepID=UPI003B218E06
MLDCYENVKGKTTLAPTLLERWKTNVKNCRTFPGADIDSDHNLLYADVKLCLKILKKARTLANYDIQSLQDESIKEKYQVEISNTFQALSNTENTPEELWCDFKDNIHKAANKVLGKRKRKAKKPWICEETLQVIDAKRQLRPQSQHSTEINIEYKKLKKDVEKRVREDKELWLEQECSRLEQYNAMHNSREFLKAAKTFDRKTATRNSNIKDKDGKLLTQSAEIKGRWREFAEELYENTDHDPPPIIEVNPSIREPSILLEEIEQAISKLGNNNLE